MPSLTEFNWKSGSKIVSKIMLNISHAYKSVSRGYAEDIIEAGKDKLPSYASEAARNIDLSGPEPAHLNQILSVDVEGARIRVDSSQWTGQGFTGFKRPQMELVGVKAEIPKPVETEEAVKKYHPEERHIRIGLNI